MKDKVGLAQMRVKDRLGNGNVRCRLSLVGIILGIMLLGCSAPGATESPNRLDGQLSSPPSVSQAPASQGQTLPISAKAIVAGKVILLEVAKTPEQQAMGLMYRKSLADDRGMLFPFSPPRPVNFWMKNTIIPLDMVFLRKGVVQAIAANVPPCTSDPCPSYGPPTITPIDNVLELRAGRAAELGLKAGDRITIKELHTTTDRSTPSRR